jgi:hypothetical protein
LELRQQGIYVSTLLTLAALFVKNIKLDYGKAFLHKLIDPRRNGKAMGNEQQTSNLILRTEFAPTQN